MARTKKTLFVTITILFLCIHTVDSLRILGLFPVPVPSHFIMFKGILEKLAERGHQVDVYSPFPRKKPIKNYTDFSFAESVPSFVNNMSYDFVVNSTGTFSVRRLINIMGNPSCQLMNLPIFQKLLRKPPTDPPYDLVITELFFSNCYLAWGRYLKVPIIGVTTLPLFDWLNEPLGNPLNLATDTSVFSDTVAPMSFYERIKNVIFSKMITFSFNSFIREQDILVWKFFGPDMPDVVELQKDLSLVLVNYHKALNGVRSFTPGVVPVGGLHIQDTDDELPEKVQKFLDDSKDGFIYFSFGSMVKLETFPKSIINVFYSTFERIAPVRVLLKITKLENLLPGLPSNVMTQTWVPQIKVLKHKNIKCFVTHGGLMGTQEAIYFGVPMVGIPLFGDQHYNIMTYAKRNLSVKIDLKEIEEETFYSAINEVLTNPVYKTTVEEVSRVFRDVPMSPLDTSIYWIEYIGRHGKHALRAPIIDMPWYQATLFDVYMFIIIFAILTIYILRFLTGKSLRYVNENKSENKPKIE